MERKDFVIACQTALLQIMMELVSDCANNITKYDPRFNRCDMFIYRAEHKLEPNSEVVETLITSHMNSIPHICASTIDITTTVVHIIIVDEDVAASLSE